MYLYVMLLAYKFSRVCEESYLLLGRKGKAARRLRASPCYEGSQGGYGRKGAEPKSPPRKGRTRHQTLTRASLQRQKMEAER